MKEVILCKSGEMILKGRNRHFFEQKVMKNMRHALEGMGKVYIFKSQSILYVEPQQEDIDLHAVVERLTKVFGIVAIARAVIVPKEFELIKQTTAQYLSTALQSAQTFGVRAKRSDKSFSLTSPQIERQLGAYLLEQFPHLSVDLTNPDLLVEIEIREKGAYIHELQRPGAGGMPVGTGGKAVLLLSGGIDSPVAGYRMARRGLELVAVHFESPPYTSERALLKVKTLCEKLSDWTGPIRLYTVPFTQAQQTIMQNIPEPLVTLSMRRYMMKIAAQIAAKENAQALITGESVGQVASQTLGALHTTNAATELLVLRPLIGMDKSEIIETAQRIDTYETSILPFEDCCTVFTPRYPKTNPTLDEIIKAEQVLDEAEMIRSALRDMTHETIPQRN